MSSNLYIECGANLTNGGFTRNHIMQPQEIIDFRLKFNNTGVYCTPYSYDSLDVKEANIISDLYIDLDYNLDSTDDAYEKIRTEAKKIYSYFKMIFKIQSDEIDLFFSGSKGLHIIIPKETLGIKPCQNLNRIFKKIVEDIVKINRLETVDIKIYDRRRLFRLPNSIHPKTGLYKVPITYEECQTLNLAQIKELAKAPRQKILRVIKPNALAINEFNRYSRSFKDIKPKEIKEFEFKKSDYKPPCIEHLLANPVLDGQRNNSMVFIISFCKQNGYEKEETLTLINKWNENNVTPSINDFEINASINSIYGSKYKYGCAAANGISVCDKKKCKFLGR